MRVPRASHYVSVPNATARDSRLTRRARGLLVELLSYPDGWETNSTALVEGGPEGRDAIRKALGELERLGYLLRVKLREADGRWATVSAVYDNPQEPGTLPPGVQFAPSHALEREPEDDVEAAEDQDGFSVLDVTSGDAASAQVSATTGNPTVGGPGANDRTLSRTPLPPSQPGRLQSTGSGVEGARRRRAARGARGQSGPESKGPAPAAPSPSAGSCPEHPSQGAAACALCIAERTTEPTETVNAVLAAARAAGAAGRARMAAAPRWTPTTPQAPPGAPRNDPGRLREPESAQEAS